MAAPVLARLPLEAYRLATLASGVAGTALFGGGLVVLLRSSDPLLAGALMLAGVVAVLAGTLLEVEGAPPAAMPSLLLLTRPECALCEEARARLDAMRSGQEGLAFDLWEQSIQGNAALEAQYGQSVPVGLVAGEEVFRLEVDEARVRAALRGG